MDIVTNEECCSTSAGRLAARLIRGRLSAEAKMVKEGWKPEVVAKARDDLMVATRLDIGEALERDLISINAKIDELRSEALDSRLHRTPEEQRAIDTRVQRHKAMTRDELIKEATAIRGNLDEGIGVDEDILDSISANLRTVGAEDEHALLRERIRELNGYDSVGFSDNGRDLLRQKELTESALQMGATQLPGYSKPDEVWVPIQLERLTEEITDATL